MVIGRCYGNHDSLLKWHRAIADFHLVARQTLAGAAKKNASDFALTIEVVELLHQDRFDHAVIVSSDMDFLQLVVHLRERGKTISGMGEGKTAVSLRSAYDQFVVLPAEGTLPTESAVKIEKVKLAPSPAISGSIDREWLRREFDKLSNGSAAVSLSGFGKTLLQLKPDYRKGHGNLSAFLEKSGLFEIRDGKVYLLRT
jgi:hypothetical protein